MSIPNDPLAAMQDIVNANSTRTTQNSFNTLFDPESMANFYTIGFNSLLSCYYCKECEDLIIEDVTSEPPNDLMTKQK